MAAVYDLTELVERAAAAEKSALASKWKDEADVQGLIRRTRRSAEEQRQAVSLDTDPERLSPRWAGLRQNYLDLGAQPALPGQEPTQVPRVLRLRVDLGRARRDPLARDQADRLAELHLLLREGVEVGGRSGGHGTIVRTAPFVAMA